MKKKFVAFNIVFIIGISTAWLLQKFGNVDGFYIFLFVCLILLDIYLVFSIKNEK